MNSIFKRLAQPSTWAGVGLVMTQATQAYVTKDPAAIGAVIAGVLAIVKNEAGA